MARKIENLNSDIQKIREISITINDHMKSEKENELVKTKNLTKKGQEILKDIKNIMGNISGNSGLMLYVLIAFVSVSFLILIILLK